MFTIRPFAFTDADYEVMIEIDSAVFSDYPMTVEEWRHIDQNRDSQFLFHRDLIALDGRVVAFGEYGQRQWSFHPQKFFFNVLVHPDREHPAIRQTYLEHVMGVLAEQNPIALTTEMLEDKEAHLRFLDAAGFEEVMRTPLSELDVMAFDPAPFAPIPEKMRDLGIRIMSVREMQDRDADWKQQLYALEWPIEQDVPSHEPPIKRTFDNFESIRLNHPNVTFEGWFVALSGDQYVGMTRVYTDDLDVEKLRGGLTGVLRSHRRRGIATALKLRLIDFAKQYGAKTLTTGNEENNPMYALNLALGFKPKPAWVEFEKPLQAE